MSMLAVENLLKRFRAPDGTTHTVVDVVSFQLGAEQHVALRGASGSGKTTFLHLIAGILAADAGKVWISGVELTGLREAQRDRVRAASIGYIFQTFNLLQGYTALENVELAMRIGGRLDHAFARHLLERVGLRDRLHHRPRQLSVGQQQRVAVARALANHPPLVLADEPTGNLDARHGAAALQLIRELCRENGAALLLVSHDRDILAQFEQVQEFDAINRRADAEAQLHEADL